MADVVVLLGQFCTEALTHSQNASVAKVRYQQNFIREH